MRESYTVALASIAEALRTGNRTVAVMCASDERARRLMRTYFEIVTPLLTDGIVKVFHQHRQIKFDNGSRIVFVVREEQLRGLRTDDIVRD